MSKQLVLAVMTCKQRICL